MLQEIEQCARRGESFAFETTPPGLGYLRHIAEWGRERMTQPELSRAKNPDLRASLAAMRRAAEMARNTAIQTNTEIVIVKDGKPVRVTAEELRKEQRT